MNTVDEGIRYAQEIVDGKIIAGKYIKLACKRFNRDLKNKNATWYFDKDKAQRILDFYRAGIKHVKGPMAGKPYQLSDWEIFALMNIFGFVYKDKPRVRRFKNWLQFVARKNSKTTLAGGAILFHLLSDGEEGAEAYSIATQRDQAKLAWESAGRMVDKMPSDARGFFKKTISAINVPEMFNTYKPLGRDSKGLDGLNVSMALFDEAAAITDRNMFEVITSSQGARDNYLNIYITTAQFNKQTAFFENYDYCKKILEGDIDDDTWFAAIYELDEGDDPFDENVWQKANPNIDKSVSRDYLRSQAKLAKEITSQRNNFLVKHCNVWTSSEEAWLPQEMWEANIIPELDRTGKLWVGVDLGATSDLTALTFLYRNNDQYHMESKCFIPESALENVPKHLKQIYIKAIDSGTLMLTPGNATDYNIVKQYLQDYIADKDLTEIAYDPWSATKWATELYEDGAPMVEVRQNMANLSPASKDTEIHIRKGEMKHLDDPFLQWQFENCSIYTNPHGDIKVRKGDDRNLKIDSMIALILAVNRASSNGGLNSGEFFFAFTPE